MSSATPKLKYTYASRSKAQLTSSSPISRLSSSPATLPVKRPLEKSTIYSSIDNIPSASKRLKLDSFKAKKTKNKTFGKQKTFTQLHFSIDTTVIRTCTTCGLTYTKGAPDDEELHKKHCNRVQKGMEWSKEEDRDAAKADISQIISDIKLKDGERGRIISMRADASGKTGSKISALLGTINVALNAPAVTPTALRASRIYLLLVPSIIPTRERIAGCVLAQRISTSMAIATRTECAIACKPASDDLQPSFSPTQTLVAVDTTTSLFCHPKPLPTPMGISRIFVPKSHRRQGVAIHLLDAATRTFIHGCILDPKKGDVAFTQPTAEGSALMNTWGAVRIYED